MDNSGDIIRDHLDRAFSAASLEFDKFLEVCVIDVTADMSRVYASERLWFVSRAGATVAVMGVSSRDAWSQVVGTSPSFTEVRESVAGMSAADVFTASEAMKRNPMYGIPYCQIETADYVPYMGILRK